MLGHPPQICQGKNLDVVEKIMPPPYTLCFKKAWQIPTKTFLFSCFRATFAAPESTESHFIGKLIKA
jgi:hypothetical protein